jgi:leucyl aminopeptidase
LAQPFRVEKIIAMNIELICHPLSEESADCLALGLFDEPFELPVAVRGTPLENVLTRLLAGKEIPAGVGDVTPLLGLGQGFPGLVSVFGLGPQARFDAGAAFSAGVAVARRLASKKRETLAVAWPGATLPAPNASALVEGLTVGTRGPDLRKSEPARRPFATVRIVAPPDADCAVLEQALRRGQIVGEAVNLARDLVNTPPSEKNPLLLAAQFQTIARAAGLDVELWDRPRIERERLGGLLGVASGSEIPPAFLAVNWLKGGDAPTLALVGKGVTFDSGGLSLKPTSSMEDMKSDMTGAAVVLAVLQAIARLERPVNVVGYAALTENMTGGGAMKLGDVLTIRNGKTVEVLNTDAEGRLILADVLSLAVEKKPWRILDLATLTGSCMVALGTRIAGLFSNNDAFCLDVLAACRATGERAWRLPLDDDFKEQLKSNVADLKNVGSKYGGAVTAAKFLETFVGDTPWVHLDIAGPSWSDNDTSTHDAGGTGCFVRTLVALIESTLCETDQQA